MPNDNDSIIHDILNELDSKSSDIKMNGDENTANADESKSDAQDKILVRNVSDIDPAETFIEKAYDESKKSLTEAENIAENEKADSKNTKENAKTSGTSIEPEKNKKKRKRKKSNRLPGVLILTTLIFAVSISLSLVIIAYGKDMLGIGKSETTQIIVIPDNSTTTDIAALLKSEGIIKSPKFFCLFSRLSKADSSYIAGEHFVRPNMAYETIIQELTSTQNNNKESVEVTFPEGINLHDAASLLEQNGVCAADEFIFYFNAGGLGFDFEKQLSGLSDLKFYRMEGYLFPDTYYFYKDMDPEQVCQKIYLNFQNKMTEQRYAKMKQLGLTLDQLITFSSIVQKEAPNTESMTMVASVFWNRLNNPDSFPLLQSDPTKIYAENVIQPNMEVFDQAMIDAYNTYVGAGLPPGAICNPGVEAIDAVLANFQSDYFYFNANVNTGQTYFSKTLEEHNANLEMVQQQYAEESATANEGETNDNQ
jgi:UPF0755 protein